MDAYRKSYGLTRTAVRCTVLVMGTTTTRTDAVLWLYLATDLVLAGAGRLPAPPALPREVRETVRPMRRAA